MGVNNKMSPTVLCSSLRRPGLVAILGVTGIAMKPVWNGTGFEPRALLPLSLSYDHRVINGADAARFVRHIGATLAQWQA